MRKFLIVPAVAMCALASNAEGYQVNTLSARQNGMGHTGTALKLGAESQIFNPSGLAFMDESLNLSGSFTAIFPTATCVNDGRQYKTCNGASTPVSVNTAFSVYDNLKAGVSFYTPYGSGIDWGENWAGAVLNQSVTLATYTVQPTVAWRVLPNLSVGAGLMLTWGTVNLDKGLVSPATTDAILAAQGIPFKFGTTTPASVNLSGTTAVAIGFNVGAMYDISSRLTVGASFRSKMNMDMKSGEATLSYANDIARQALADLQVLNEANFKASMPCPFVLNLGISYRPVDKLTLAFDAQLTGWGAYKSLDIEFLSEQLTPYNQHLVKDYRNSWTYHVGARYEMTQRLDLRAGLMVDTSPVNKAHYNPETPGMTKVEPSVGFSFRPLKNLSIDAAFVYVAGLGADNVSCDYIDLLAAKVPALGLPSQRTFTADYRVHALIPSIGLSYSF